MLDEQHCQLVIVAKPQDEVTELLHLLVVETAGRLVEQQKPRLRSERTGDLDPLLDPIRQGGGALVGAITKADVVEGRTRLLLPDRAAARVRTDEDVLEHGHRREHVDVLERARDAPFDDPVCRRL